MATCEKILSSQVVSTQYGGRDRQKDRQRETLCDSNTALMHSTAPMTVNIQSRSIDNIADVAAKEAVKQYDTI